MKDYHRAGRAASVTTDFNIGLVRELLKGDRGLTCAEMAQELEIGVGSIQLSATVRDEEGFGPLGTPSHDVRPG